MILFTNSYDLHPIELGAEVEVVRCIIKNNRDIGVIALGAGSKISLKDVFISDTLSQESDDMFGRGLSVLSGAEAEVVRSIIKNNRDIGVFTAGAGSKISLKHVSISDTKSRLSDGRYGRGLHVQEGAKAEVVRSIIKNNRDVGVFAADAGTKINMSDIIISGTLKRQCATDEIEAHQTICEGGSGDGIVSIGEALIEMKRFVVIRNEFIGVQIAYGMSEDGNIYEMSGKMNLNSGIISYNKIGLNIQSSSCSYFDAFENIFWWNNTNNTTGDALIVPEAGHIDISFHLRID